MKIEKCYCPACGHRLLHAEWNDLKYEIWSKWKASHKCARCGKRGAYEKDGDRWLCYDCWVDETGLPF